MEEKSLKSNSILNIIRSVLGLLFPLITFKYASVILGPDGIGAANYAQSIITYFQLLATFGITTYAIAEGAKLRRDPDKFKEFTCEIFTINLLSTSISYSLLLLLSIGGLFGHHNIYVLILSISLFFSLIGVEWMFVIYEQFRYITLRSLFFQILSFCLLFVLVRTKNDTAEYVSLIVISTVGSSVFNYYKSRSICKIKLVTLTRIRRHLKHMLIIFGTSIASLIYVNSDMVVLGILKSDTEVGIYAAGVKIIKAICVPIASVGLVAVPRISEKIVQGSIGDVETICNRVLHFMSFFIFPFLVGIFLFSKEAILLLSGPEFLSGVSVIKLLIIDVFLSPINGFLVSQLLIPFGKQNISFYATLGGAFGNILLDILLIPKFSFVGAAFATVISELIVFCTCIPFLCKKFNLLTVVNGCWQYVVGAIVIIPIYYLGIHITANYLINTIIIVFVSAALYLLFLLRMENFVANEAVQLVKKRIGIKNK